MGKVDRLRKHVLGCLSALYLPTPDPVPPTSSTPPPYTKHVLILYGHSWFLTKTRWPLPFSYLGMLFIYGYQASPQTKWYTHSSNAISTVSKLFHMHNGNLPTPHSPFPTFLSPLSSLHSPLSTLNSPLSTLHSPFPNLHSPLPALHSPYMNTN